MNEFLIKNKSFISYLMAVIAITLFTYVLYYYNPPSVFWDENYHIAAAQKYLGGIMFMEPHPPLGKLFISLGEWLVNANANVDTNQFLLVDHIKNFPQGYSFAGVRFFPTMFGASSAILFFLIFLKISKHLRYSFLFTSLYLFANSFIIQSRSAMLESTQIFFIFLTVLYFLHLFDKEKTSLKEMLIFGVLMGLSVSVKLNSLIIILLYPFLFFYQQDLTIKKQILLKYFVKNGAVVMVGLLGVFSFVFYIHFALGGTLGNNHYKSSAEYRQILSEHSNASVLSFPTMMKDNLKFIAEYSNGVPRLDVCKVGENGSHPSSWPLGNKSINYRWDKNGDLVRYLYLQSNPVIWFSVALSMLVALSLLVAKFVFSLPIKDQRLFYLVSVFSGMYFSYMAVMLSIGRVMYLYHYFMPLFFGMFVLFLLFNYIFKEKIEAQSNKLTFSVIAFVLLIILSFYWYSPFTYYQPLNYEDFMQRVIFDFWKLTPIR